MYLYTPVLKERMQKQLTLTRFNAHPSNVTRQDTSRECYTSSKYYFDFKMWFLSP